MLVAVAGLFFTPHLVGSGLLQCLWSLFGRPLCSGVDGFAGITHRQVSQKLNEDLGVRWLITIVAGIPTIFHLF